MDERQEMEWEEAQRTVISVDLVAAAKQQIHFLKVIDRNRWLYEGPGLLKAIYRYNACWLPLLAAHNDYQVSKGPLVVPLDCEWIWHCHRLNPVRYKSDCEELYGKIIDSCNVVSSLRGFSKTETENIWNRIYPEEPYEFDINVPFPEATPQKPHQNFVTYDLASAVQRQSPFVYQVSREHMNHDLFLQEAFSRYKGFLYLKRKNEEQSITQFNVPTYDIDLMWHSHILHPVYYCTDTTRALGKILEHVEDADRTKGKKLDKGFTDTTKQWEETFGTRYSKAGAMFRGLPPKPVTTLAYRPNGVRNRVVSFAPCPDVDQLFTPIPEKTMVEVYIEIIDVKNLLYGFTEAESISVYVSKEKPDMFFTSKRKLSIMSLSGKKQITTFQCEATGKFLFELSYQTKAPKLHFSKADRPLGSFLLPLSDFLPPVSKLSVEKWYELSTGSTRAGSSSKPLSLRVALSVAIPTVAPTVLLLMVIPSKPASRKFCFFPLQERMANSRSLTRIEDVSGTQIITFQMRMVRGCLLVEGVTKQGFQMLAKRVKGVWFIDRCSWTLRKATDGDEFIFELKGNKTVRFYRGRKLDYEPKCCSKEGDERKFLTAIEFSEDHPYGKALAIINWKSGYLVVSETWFLQHGMILAYIISDVMRREAADEMRSVRPDHNIDAYFNGDNGECVGSEHRNESSQGARVVPLE